MYVCIYIYTHIHAYIYICVCVCVIVLPAGRWRERVFISFDLGPRVNSVLQWLILYCRKKEKTKCFQQPLGCEEWTSLTHLTLYNLVISHDMSQLRECV